MLLHVPGATSDEDLRTPPGSKAPLSYKEAAVERGLVNDDREYNLAMQEAAALRSAARLRELFAYLLVHCEPVPALERAPGGVSWPGRSPRGVLLPLHHHLLYHRRLRSRG